MQKELAAQVRGTIIKVPDGTPGLVMLDGAQRSFVLEGVWRANVAPAPNLVVEAELDESGGIVALHVIDNEQLARERFQQLGGAAQEQGRLAAELANKGIGTLAARMGKPALGAAVALWIAWFFLPALKVSILTVQQSFTFWEILGKDLGNPLSAVSGSSHGLLSLLGVAALVAPFAAPFVRHPRANLLYAAPFAHLVLFGASTWWTLRGLAKQAEEAMGPFGVFGQAAMQGMGQHFSDMVSFSYGAFVLVAGSLYLANHGRKFSSDVGGFGVPVGAIPARARLAIIALALLGGAGWGAAQLIGGISKSALTEGLNKKFEEKKGACWSITQPEKATFPLRVNDIMGGMSKDPVLQGLQKSGLITLEQGGRYLGAASIITLTPEGQAANIWDPQRGFCVGVPRVHEITNFTEPNANAPIPQILVSYTWKLENQPSWVQADKFASVPGMKEPVEAKAAMQKTDSGWQVADLF